MDDVVIVILKLGLIMFLVLLNGFFVAAEFSLVKVRDTQLDGMVASGHRRAKIARKVVRNLDAALSATQLGITLASLGLGWVAEPIFESLLHPVFAVFGIESHAMQETLAITVGFFIITFLHIVAGELAPKSMAIQYLIQAMRSAVIHSLKNCLLIPHGMKSSMRASRALHPPLTFLMRTTLKPEMQTAPPYKAT